MPWTYGILDYVYINSYALTYDSVGNIYDNFCAQVLTTVVGIIAQILYMVKKFRNDTDISCQ